MATTDKFVKYDIRFFEQFSKYLNFKQQDIKALRRAVELGLLQRERLVELAISRVGNVAMSSTHGQDLADTTDVKTVVSSIRNNNKRKGTWTHSLPVRKIASKKGPLRVVAYNKLLDDFHYFFIPHSAYQHCTKVVEIVLDQVSGLHDPHGAAVLAAEPNRSRQWWQYEVGSFEQMCATRPRDVRPRQPHEPRLEQQE
jgi:hypothetical protein